MIQTLRDLISEYLGSDDFEVKVEGSVERGHLSTNAAFIAAERDGKKPREAAEDLRSFLHKKAPETFFDRIEVAGGGFVNVWVKDSVIRGELKKIIAAKGAWGKQKRGKETIIVEYSAPNIAKRMHIGHLRSTIIGDALANIFDYLGYKVVRWNYLGDWGTQFGKLIAAYKLWGSKKKVKKNPVEELEQLYIRFHREIKENPELEDRGREEFKKLEDGDRVNKKLWHWFKKVSLREFGQVYNLLGVNFTTHIGESYYQKNLKETIDYLKEEKIAHESEGALMIDLERFELPSIMIRKSDGATLYFTREIANLKYRIDEYEPSKILYVVANEQALHFSQLFAVAKVLGLTEGENAPELTHVKFGLVRGEEGKKLSTREGSAIKLQELLNRSISLAKDVLKEREADIKKSEIKELSEMVGIGAVKYNDLSQNRLSDIVFDWDKMLSFEGNSGPYLQYTHARLRSILKKAKRVPKPDLQALDNEKDQSLVLKLAEFPNILDRVSVSYLPNLLANYLYELAREVNSYYHSEPVLYSEPGLRNVRLNLVKATADTLRVGLKLLGIGAPDKM